MSDKAVWFSATLPGNGGWIAGRAWYILSRMYTNYHLLWDYPFETRVLITTISRIIKTLPIVVIIILQYSGNRDKSHRYPNTVDDRDKEKGAKANFSFYKAGLKLNVS